MVSISKIGYFRNKPAWPEFRVFMVKPTNMARVLLHSIPLPVVPTIGLMEMDMISRSLSNSETLELMVSFFQKIKLFQTPKKTWKAFALLSTISREFWWRKRATFNLYLGEVFHTTAKIALMTQLVFSMTLQGVLLIFSFYFYPFYFRWVINSDS